MPKGWLSLSTSLAVKEYIEEKGEAWPGEIAQNLQEIFAAEDYSSLPDQESISRILECCKKLDLVKTTKEERGKRTRGIERKFYQLKEPEDPEFYREPPADVEIHKAWRNPCKAYYRPSEFDWERPLSPAPETLKAHIEKMIEERWG
ncbi:hypothetical protein AKJ64_01015 [candidate division MSBL1 archaeon SCGC-AAA259E17]|uniref:Uncharacterized protein n=1 Tax=candidate division MSBL1 archaeon SCGC-AAA259E17 TaxID=1698263 RepID=A0A133UGH1_9EURY|nr:hypothetical protein AKJ64_01015 [candidate division MSBL1 archaeon SCGC-AAA259E17]